MIIPGPWNPTKLSGCSVWLRASVGVATSGSDVLSVADQSGKGKNVTAEGTPKLASSVISNLPGIQFTGTGDSLGGTGSL
jgi:hypothetical protein